MAITPHAEALLPPSLPIRRSVQLAQWNVFISDWPVPKILDYLFHRNITPPTGLSHQDLFAFFLSSSDEVLTPSPPPSPALAKAKAKRKYTASVTSTSSAKRPCSEIADNKDPVLAALLGIKASLKKLDKRVIVLWSVLLPLFYEYHKSFSAKAAIYIQRFNLRLDWSIVDLELISRHFTGHRAISCSVCGSFSQFANLCPRIAFQSASDSSAQHSKLAQGTKNFSRSPSKVNSSDRFTIPICINFNEFVCLYMKCRYLHCCSLCGDSHPRAGCPRRYKASPQSSSKI